MKIIALMPVKNEAWILPLVFSQLKPYCDEILCLDNQSSDETQEVARQFGVKIREQSDKKVNYSSWRQELLDWGREEGGTHFIWLDADEAFTSQFLKSFRETLDKMKPGEKLVLRWLCLWQDPYVYRSDGSVWSNLYKDFVFCDDGISNFENTLIHESRTPGLNSEENSKKITTESGAVLHFQFVPFKRFQIKQAYQRCRELLMGVSIPKRINQRYSVTLPSPTALVKPIPKVWLSSFGDLNYLKDAPYGWYYDDILRLFNGKGVEFFEPLQIWHIPEFHNIFVSKLGREPKTETFHPLLVKANNIKNKLKSLLK